MASPDDSCLGQSLARRDSRDGNPSDTVEPPNKHSSGFDCNFCEGVKLSNPTVPGGEEHESPQTLFHDHCANCARYERKVDSNLCIRCRHLRIRHLLLCRGCYLGGIEYLPMDTVENAYRSSSYCDFCQVVATTIDMHASLQGMRKCELWGLDIQIRI